MIDVPEAQLCCLPSGGTIAWREWGTGTPLIMLHGWSASSTVFSEVAPLLAEKYRVLCPDLPGHGQSDALADCRLKKMALVIEEWAEMLDLNDLALLGWSLGGQIALKVAIENRLVINKLLLVSTTPCFCQTDDWMFGLPTVQLKALDRNLGRCYEKTLGDFFNLQFVDENLSKDRYRQIIAFAVRAGVLPKQAVAREVLKILGQEDLRHFLSSIKLPTHILHGDIDQIIPFSAGEYLADSIPNASLQRFIGVGHAPFFSFPQEAVEHWLTFLQ